MTEEKWKARVVYCEWCWFCAKCHEPVGWDELHGCVFSGTNDKDGEEIDEILCSRCYNEFLAWFEAWCDEDDDVDVDPNPTDSAD